MEIEFNILQVNTTIEPASQDVSLDRCCICLLGVTITTSGQPLQLDYLSVLQTIILQVHGTQLAPAQVEGSQHMAMHILRH